MAKNWTVAEAVVKIKENDFASIKDIGGRFALFEHLCAKAIAGDGEAFVELMSNMPEYVTVGKIEKVLKADISGDGEAEDAEAVEEKVEEKPKRGRGRKKAEPVEDDGDSAEESVSYDDMTAKELFNLCKERKIKVEPKQKASVYIKLLKDADEKAAKSKKVEDDDDDWGDDDDEVEEKKPAKKTTAKSEKKAPKKPEPKDDDDEDWDI